MWRDSQKFPERNFLSSFILTCEEKPETTQEKQMHNQKSQQHKNLGRLPELFLL